MSVECAWYGCHNPATTTDRTGDPACAECCNRHEINLARLASLHGLDPIAAATPLAPQPLTEADVRRIVREELAKHGWHLVRGPAIDLPAMRALIREEIEAADLRACEAMDYVEPVASQPSVDVRLGPGSIHVHPCMARYNESRASLVCDCHATVDDDGGLDSAARAPEESGP